MRKNMIKRFRFFVILAIIFVAVLYFIKHLVPKNVEEKFYSDYSYPDRQELAASRTEEINFRLVTAFAQNHFREALRNCYIIGNLKETQNWSNGFMIAYLLGDIPKDLLNRYQKVCPFVELRDFQFEKFPKFVKNLNEYRWKPLIIQEMVEEYGDIFYFDTSAVFKNHSNETIKSVMHEQHQNFSKCGIRQFEKTGHTIFAATNPKMFTFFDFTEQMAKKNQMFTSTIFTVTKSQKSKEIIEKFVNCALEKECMGPTGSFKFCIQSKVEMGEYGDCHGFDQSALAILLAQCSDKQNDYFHQSSVVAVQRM